MNVAHLETEFTFLSTELPTIAVNRAVGYLAGKIRSPYRECDLRFSQEIFCGIWRPIRNTYLSLWEPGSKFIQPVNIMALTMFAEAKLQVAAFHLLCDINDTCMVERLVSMVINPDVMPLEYWQSAWAVNVINTVSTRELIKQDLMQMTLNKRLNQLWTYQLELPSFPLRLHQL